MNKPEPPAARRQAAQRYGQAAESLAAIVLRLKGYRVIARQVRTPVGEIDIIARRGRVLAFVEVKARTTEPTAETLSVRQKQRIIRAAKAFVARHTALQRLDPRFDLMLVGSRRWPRHLRDAFRTDD